MYYRVRIECYSKQIGVITEKRYGKEYISKTYVFLGMVYHHIKAEDLEAAKARSREIWRGTDQRWPDSMKALKIFEGEVTRLSDLNVKPVFESDNLIKL